MAEHPHFFQAGAAAACGVARERVARLRVWLVDAHIFGRYMEPERLEVRLSYITSRYADHATCALRYTNSALRLVRA